MPTKPSHCPFHLHKHISLVQEPAGQCLLIFAPHSQNQPLSSKVHPIDLEHERLRFTLTQRQACGCPWKPQVRELTARPEKEQTCKAKDAEMRMQSEVAARLWESWPERLQKDASKCRPNAAPDLMLSRPIHPHQQTPKCWHHVGSVLSSMLLMIPLNSLFISFYFFMRWYV